MRETERKAQGKEKHEDHSLQFTIQISQFSKVSDLCTSAMCLITCIFPSRLIHNMESESQTGVGEFLLLGLSEDPELQPLFFGLFLTMYLVTVLGNLFITLAVSSDSHLHTPMYFSLSHLPFTDISFSTTTVLKMLVNLQTQSKSITYAGCLAQVNPRSGLFL